MIYLGESAHIDWKTGQFSTILKIGYTADENKDKRLLNYISHNPSFKFIVEIPGGTEEQEKKLHYKFKKFRISGNEWYTDTEEIRDFFNTCTLEDIDKLKSPLKKGEKLENRYPRVEIKDDWENDIKDFFSGLNKCKKDYMSRVKYICEFLVNNSNLKESIINILPDLDKIKQQLITIGPERMKGLGYNLTRINRVMGITIFDRSTLDSVIFSEFIPGQRYTKKYIKKRLGEIYKAADFKGTPKATDLENWFEIKDTRITIDGKREIGFEIIKIKTP